MTQASVDSLALNHVVKEFDSRFLSRNVKIVKIVIQRDSSTSKAMASRLGISIKSKHIQLRHLWIQDTLSEGVVSLEKVGTHHNPSNVLTKFLQTAVLGHHFPKLNHFKDSFLSQVNGYLQVSRNSMSCRMSKTINHAELMQFFREYTFKNVIINKVENLHKVKSVWFILIQFRRDKRLSFLDFVRHHIQWGKHSILPRERRSEQQFRFRWFSKSDL